ncbi:MAG: C39 family peptidase [Chloroflexota bacterium]|nr:C39 family peptidase [Chloroflexota bacterium]
MRLLRWLGLLGLVLVASSQPARAAEPAAPILFTRLPFNNGTLDQVLVEDGRLLLAPGASSGEWTSAPVEPGFGFDRLVASWNAETPSDAYIRVEVQATTDTGVATDWYVLGLWAASDTTIRRTSLRGQEDTLARVDTDTLFGRQALFTAYSLRLRLERGSGDDMSPSVRMLGAQVSHTSFSNAAPSSAPLGFEAVELAVPSYSQEVHARHYPLYGGGGEAWCSPTSTEMVVEYWSRGPTAADLAWVDPGHPDPSVDHAARGTYDAAYRGTGNWPFNTAYAATFGLTAFVTQLRSLAEAERLVRAGIPLVASIASRPGELEGFLFAGGTSGHLVVIVGFDASGNPIVNDPAAWSDAAVRRVYDRAQFERVWLRGSQGTVYVIHPPEVGLPPPPADATANW